jgi:hypothetical protein
MLRALFPQAVSMPTQRSLHATVKLHSQYYYTDVQALVDSGATDNFISPTLVKPVHVHTLVHLGTVLLGLLSVMQHR